MASNLVRAPAARLGARRSWIDSWGMATTLPENCARQMGRSKTWLLQGTRVLTTDLLPLLVTDGLVKGESGWTSKDLDWLWPWNVGRSKIPGGAVLGSSERNRAGLPSLASAMRCLRSPKCLKLSDRMNLGAKTRDSANLQAPVG